MVRRSYLIASHLGICGVRLKHECLKHKDYHQGGIIEGVAIVHNLKCFHRYILACWVIYSQQVLLQLLLWNQPMNLVCQVQSCGMNSSPISHLSPGYISLLCNKLQQRCTWHPTIRSSMVIAYPVISKLLARIIVLPASCC